MKPRKSYLLLYRRNKDLQKLIFGCIILYTLCGFARSDEPFLFALVDGLCEVGVVVHDGGVGALGRLRALRLVGVVGALVTEHVANEEDQGAEDGEDHHGDDPSDDGRVSVDSISYGLALSWVIRKISTG